MHLRNANAMQTEQDAAFKEPLGQAKSQLLSTPSDQNPNSNQDSDMGAPVRPGYDEQQNPDAVPLESLNEDQMSLNYNPTRWEYPCDKDKLLENREMYMGDYFPAIMRNIWSFKTKQQYDDYFPRQAEITPKMRTIVFSWLSEVVSKLRMHDMVLWRTFDILDRFLTQFPVRKDEFQLTACSALLLAAKHDEIYPPQINDLVIITNHSVESSHLRQAELSILDTLDFRLTRPNFYTFLQRLLLIAYPALKTQTAKDRVKWLSYYVMERIATEQIVLSLRPDDVASVVMFTILYLTQHPWTDVLTEATGLTKEILKAHKELNHLAMLIKIHILEPENRLLQGIIDKYSDETRGAVATLRRRNRTKQ